MCYICCMDDFVKIYDDCIRIARWLGANQYDAQDIVQEFYAALAAKKDLSKYKIDGVPNKGYVYISIRNQFLKHKGKESIYIELDESHMKQNEPESVILDIDYGDIRWYDQKLFEIYIEENHSIRSLSKATGINKSSIYRTLKHVKENIKCTRV